MIEILFWALVIWFILAFIDECLRFNDIEKVEYTFIILLIGAVIAMVLAVIFVCSIVIQVTLMF